MNDLLETQKQSADKDENLRPMTLADYCGQDEIRNNVSVFIQSARIRQCALDHLLFYGPPGLGKTTIAGIIANEMNSKMKVTSGPAIDRPGDLAALLLNLEDGDIFFIDEIHRLPKTVEEVLYSAMEDYAIDVIVGENNESRSVRIPLPRFTLIGATTRVGAIAAPLRDRFGSIHRLELYSPESLAGILKRDAEILNVKISDKGALEIARRARGTPRIAIRLLKRVRDFAVVAGKTMIDKKISDSSLSALGIDKNGLDSTDMRILRAMHENFQDGPVGLETLASFIGEDAVTIEDVSEPFLMQCGFLSKTPRGRVLTQKGIDYLSEK